MQWEAHQGEQLYCYFDPKSARREALLALLLILGGFFHKQENRYFLHDYINKHTSTGDLFHSLHNCPASSGPRCSCFRGSQRVILPDPRTTRSFTHTHHTHARTLSRLVLLLNCSPSLWLQSKNDEQMHKPGLSRKWVKWLFSPPIVLVFTLKFLSHKLFSHLFHERLCLLFVVWLLALSSFLSHYSALPFSAVKMHKELAYCMFTPMHQHLQRFHYHEPACGADMPPRVWQEQASRWQQATTSTAKHWRALANHDKQLCRRMRPQHLNVHTGVRTLHSALVWDLFILLSWLIIKMAAYIRFCFLFFFNYSNMVQLSILYNKLN